MSSFRCHTVRRSRLRYGGDESPKPKHSEPVGDSGWDFAFPLLIFAFFVLGALAGAWLAKG